MQTLRSSNLGFATFFAPVDQAGAATLASARRGMLPHAEHMADLVLDITPGAQRGQLPGFEMFDGFVRRFIGQIEAREIGVLNEKFDGSPALLLGFDIDNRPFVAYKHHIKGKRGPRIVHTVKEAKQILGRGPFGQILEDSIRHLRRRLLRFKNKDVIFQADLLFTPRNGAMVVSDGEVRIRANSFGIEYILPRGSKFYEFAKRSKIGLVVHTVFKRSFNEETGAVDEGAPIEDVDLIEDLVKTLRTEDIFAIDPWSRRVQIDQGEDTFTREKRDELERIIAGVHTGLTALTPEFRIKWGKFIGEFKVFLNSSLKKGRSGGLYRAADVGEKFNFELLAERFHEWLMWRSNIYRVNPKGVKRWVVPKKRAGEFEDLFDTHNDELRRYFRAYYDAVRVQYMLRPHMEEAYSSKLGGGRIEGMMITDDATMLKVKLVDPAFTRENFAGEEERTLAKRLRRARKRGGPEKKIRMPQLYRKWRGGKRVSQLVGAAFFLGKLQPPHAGHIAMLKSAISYFGLENLFIMPSNKVPNFTAHHWREIGATKNNTKKELAARDFSHVFSLTLREDILRHGLPEATNIHFANTRTFWRYLNRAKTRGRRGQVALIMGQKELEEVRYLQQMKRFADHVVAFPIDMQSDGLSATHVRQAVKNLYENGDIGSYDFLAHAYSFITPVKERDSIIGRMIREWDDLDALVTSLI